VVWLQTSCSALVQGGINKAGQLLTRGRESCLGSGRFSGATKRIVGLLLSFLQGTRALHQQMSCNNCKTALQGFRRRGIQIGCDAGMMQLLSTLNEASHASMLCIHAPGFHESGFYGNAICSAQDKKTWQSTFLMWQKVKSSLHVL
jgi:hypothetical protein